MMLGDVGILDQLEWRYFIEYFIRLVMIVERLCFGDEGYVLRLNLILKQISFNKE